MAGGAGEWLDILSVQHSFGLCVLQHVTLTTRPKYGKKINVIEANLKL